MSNTKSKRYSTLIIMPILAAFATGTVKAEGCDGALDSRQVGSKSIDKSADFSYTTSDSGAVTRGFSQEGAHTKTNFKVAGDTLIIPLNNASFEPIPNSARCGPAIIGVNFNSTLSPVNVKAMHYVFDHGQELGLKNVVFVTKADQQIDGKTYPTLDVDFSFGANQIFSKRPLGINTANQIQGAGGVSMSLDY